MKKRLLPIVNTNSISKVTFSVLLLFWLIGGVALSSVASVTGSGDTFATDAYTIDRFDPTATVSSITFVNIGSSTEQSTGIALVGSRVTVSFSTSGAVQPPAVTIDGQSATVTDIYGNNYVAEYILKATDLAGNIPITIQLTDLAGNPGITNATAAFTYNNVQSITATGVLAPLTTIAGTPSATTQFALSLVNLRQSPVQIVVPAGFEFASSPAGSFITRFTFTPPLDTTLMQIYVRLTATAAAGTYSASNILIGNAGISTKVAIPPSTVFAVVKSIKPVNSVSNASSVNFMVTFSDTVGNLSPANFSLSSSGVSSPYITAILNISHFKVYRVTVNTGSGDGTIALNLDNITNVLSTGTIITTLPFLGDTVTIEKNPPAISSANITGNSPTGNTLHTGDSATLLFTTSQTVQTPTVVIAGHAVAVTNTGGNSYSATYTFLSTDAPGPISYNISLTNLLGNTASTSYPSSLVLNTTPVIITAGTLTPLNTLPGIASASTNFSASAYNITSGNIVATAPAGFEISTDGSTFGTTATLGNGSATVPATTLYVRLAASDAVGNYSGDVVLSAAGATDVHVATASSIVALQTTQIMYISKLSSSPSNALTVDYNVTFANAVTGLSASNFSLSTSGSISNASIVSISGSGSNYTVTVSTGTGDGNITLDLANTANTQFTVTNTLPFAGDTYTIGKTPPAANNLSITTSNANPALAYPGDVITIKFTASEPLSIFQPLVDYQTPGISNSGSDYTLTYTMQRSDNAGPVIVSLLMADNASNFYSNNITSSVVFNPQSPVAVQGITALNSSAPTNASLVRYGVAFSGPVDNLTGSNFGLTTTGTIAGATVAAIQNNHDNTYSVDINTGTGDGDITLSLANATNLSTGITTALPFTGDSYTIDKTPPAANNLSITTSNANPALAYPGDVITIKFTASEPLSIFQPLVDYQTPGISNSGSDYTLTYTMRSSDNAGPVIVSLLLADNASNFYSNNITSSVIFNPQSPVAVQGITASNSSTPTNASLVRYRVSFSGPVDNLSGGNFTLTATGTISGAAIAAIQNNHDNTYSVDVYTGTGDGDITLSLANATNLSTGIATALPFAGGTFSIDKTRPAVNSTITSATVGGQTVSYGNIYIGSKVSITFHTSEPVQLPAVVIDGQNATVTQQEDATSFLATYTFSGIESQSTIVVITTLTDLAGNSTGATTLAPFNFISVPTITLTGTLASLSTTAGTPSATTQFHITANNISYGTPVVVTAPVGFQVSSAAAGTFANTISLPGNLNYEQDVYVRVASYASVGLYSGDVVVSSAGATDAHIATASSGVGPITTKIISLSNGGVTSPGNASSVNYTLTFTNPIPAPPVNVFSLTTTGTISGATVSSVTAVNANTDGLATVYNITVNTGTGDGNITLNYTSYPYLYYVQISNSLPFAGDTYTIDKTAPAVSNVVFTTTNAKPLVANIGDVVTLTFTASEVLQNSSTVFTIAGAGESLTHISGNNYQVTHTMTASDITGPVEVTGSLFDLTGNNLSFDQTSAIVFDNTATTANLSGLSVSEGTLSPVFSPGTTSYKDTVSNATASIIITPTRANLSNTVQVNGTVVSPGAGSAVVALVAGTNTIQTKVTAADGITHKTYTITVIRLANNAYLSNLTISSGTLSPVFDKGTGSYKDTVASSVASVTLTPVLNNPHATISVNGTAVLSGSNSASIPLGFGNNTIKVVVTAQDGVTHKTYTVTVRRPVSTNAALANLTVSEGTLSPVFVPGTPAYTDIVSNATASLTVTPTVADPGATVTVNGTTLASGTPSASIPLAVGNNTVNIVVIAQDEKTRQKYTIVVTRVSNNAYLTNLDLSSGTLSPVFVKYNGSYSASVPNGVTSITVTPTLNNPHAIIKVNGTTITSGTASSAIPLNVGDNAISTIVTAQDGITHKTYTVVVNRAASGLNSLYLPGSSEQTPLVSLLSEKVEASNILSPNGDGVNDIWVVKNIAFYPDNTVTVYDRAGKIVFTKKGYNNDWDGAYRGSALNEGTYYYLVELGNGQSVKGFITVVSH